MTSWSHEPPQKHGWCKMKLHRRISMVWLGELRHGAQKGRYLDVFFETPDKHQTHQALLVEDMIKQGAQWQLLADDATLAAVVSQLEQFVVEQPPSQHSDDTLEALCQLIAKWKQRL